MEQLWFYLITGYFAVINLLGFTLMGIDKQKARKNAWRIPERTLILVAFIGGGIGALIGMYHFRHKTKHTKFIILLPLAAGFSVFIGIMLYRFLL
jgi:uncharacterized membrane protein YsdA (DUF1294 family)